MLKLFLVVPIFCGHALVFFLLYGHGRSLPHFLQNEFSTVILPSAVAFALYSWTFFRAPLFRLTKWRAPKLLAVAFFTTLISLYVGILFAFNTYGT